MSIDLSDQRQTEMGQSYFIPNQNYEIFHKRGLKTLSTRDISIQASLYRPNDNPFIYVNQIPIAENASIPVGIQSMLNSGLIKAHEVISDAGGQGLHLTSLSYSISEPAGGPNVQMNMKVSYSEN